MDDAYDYKIGADDFDPETVLPEIGTLGDQLSAVLQKKLSPDQQRTFEDHLLDCLAGTVFGSNMKCWRRQALIFFEDHQSTSIPRGIERVESDQTLLPNSPWQFSW
ncbi:hypothetical protein N7454_010746 [Penicillium verhagenii]|nr:hypothetical protein N7454_010746 [Penicillium verhagenii]